MGDESGSEPVADRYRSPQFAKYAKRVEQSRGERCTIASQDIGGWGQGAMQSAIQYRETGLGSERWSISVQDAYGTFANP